MKDEFGFAQNRFFVLGSGDIKYTYNNGILALDPKLASTNFLNALFKIPSLLEKQQQKLCKKELQFSILKEVVNAEWRNKSELDKLKFESENLGRKIQKEMNQNGDFIENYIQEKNRIN